MENFLNSATFIHKLSRCHCQKRPDRMTWAGLSQMFHSPRTSHTHCINSETCGIPGKISRFPSFHSTYYDDERLILSSLDEQRQGPWGNPHKVSSVASTGFPGTVLTNIGGLQH